MNVILKSFRIRINRAPHDQALRFKIALRDKWTAQVSGAMERKDTYDQLHAIVSAVERANENGTLLSE